MSTPDPVAGEALTPTLTLTPFDVTRKLAAELAAGDVRLPSFPDVVERLQQVLADPAATPAQVARLLGADAALAARVLRIANSAVFNAAGRPVTALPAAISRLGFELVRSAALSFALRQMQLVDADSALRAPLQELWRKGTLVAAIGYVVARETGAARPDEALVAGLLHNVGRLYLLLRARTLTSAVIETGLWEQVSHDWHPRIGAAILAHWRFPEPVVLAVTDQNAWERPPSGGGALTDVLIVATSLVPCVYCRELLDDTVTAVAPFRRLGLATADCGRLLGATAAQIQGLRDALAA
ncbi:MAG TPA: HDOD domain-containing protein [Steroidobacteraceae bacterium]|nr:HDOD domain-containing protein [Steroidobacteraceae bacterium]